MLILYQIYTLFSNDHEIYSSHYYFRNIKGLKLVYILEYKWFKTCVI